MIRSQMGDYFHNCQQSQDNLPYKTNPKISSFIFIHSGHHHHHHHVAPSARISLTLSHHPSLSSIASGRFSGLHLGSAQSCCMQVLAFARPCEGVHRSTSLMSSSLLLQQCPACLVRLILIVFVIGGKWPYSLLLCGVLPPGLIHYYLEHPSGHRSLTFQLICPGQVSLYSQSYPWSSSSRCFAHGQTHPSDYGNTVGFIQVRPSSGHIS